MTKTEIADKMAFTVQEIDNLIKEKKETAKGYNDLIEEKTALLITLATQYQHGEATLFDKSEKEA